jgi:hypothetical protein
MMRGHRENSKKVLASSGIPSSAKSRDLSVPPGLALHTPVGPELAQQTCPKSLMWGLLLCCRNFIISTASLQHLQQTYFKTFLLFLFYYSLSKQTFFFKKGKDMMRGHRENSKKVLASSGISSSAKSRDLSIPPGLDVESCAGSDGATFNI